MRGAGHTFPCSRLLRVQELFPGGFGRVRGKGYNPTKEKGKRTLCLCSLLPGEQGGNKTPPHAGVCPVIKSTSVFYNQLQGFITKASGFPRGLCAQTTTFPGVHKSEVEFWKGDKPSPLWGSASFSCSCFRSGVLGGKTGFGQGVHHL